MRRAGRQQKLGLWLAGLAIGIKVVLAAFAAMPMPVLGDDGLPAPNQVICTGSGFLVVERDGAGGIKTRDQSHCPLCLSALPLILAGDPPTAVALLLFLVLLAFPAGLDRRRHEAPPRLGFASRAPPPGPLSATRQ